MYIIISLDYESAHKRNKRKQLGRKLANKRYPNSRMSITQFFTSARKSSSVRSPLVVDGGPKCSSLSRWGTRGGCVLISSAPVTSLSSTFWTRESRARVRISTMGCTGEQGSVSRCVYSPTCISKEWVKFLKCQATTLRGRTQPYMTPGTHSLLGRLGLRCKETGHLSPLFTGMKFRIWLWVKHVYSPG